MINNFTVYGRLTSDVKLLKTKSEQNFALFTLANEEYYKGEKNTNFIPVTFWGDKAVNLSRQVGKGTPIVVVGKISTKTTKLSNGEFSKDFRLIGREYSLIGSANKNNDSSPRPSTLEENITDSAIDYSKGAGIE